MAEKLTRRAALACLGSGALATLWGTSGFTAVNADRDVSVQISDSDQTAILGLIDQSDTASIENAEDVATPLRLIDNVGEISTETISAEVIGISQNGQVVNADPPLESTVVSGNQENEFNVNLSCGSGSDSLDGSYSVEFVITATGSDLQVTAARTTRSEISISCVPETVRPDGTETEPINTNGDVILSSGTNLDVDIDQSSSVTLESGGEVNGNIYSEGNVTIDSGRVVNGDVCAGGDIILGNGANVNGNVTSRDGSVTLNNGAKVGNGGNVVADDAVTQGGGATVEGNVLQEQSNVSCQ